MSDAHIHSDPNILMGKPVVAGTHVTVELILEKLGSGETIEEILEAHPRVTKDGLLAAVRFGAEALRADGHDVSYVAELSPSVDSDQTLGSLALVHSHGMCRSGARSSQH
jgi:uncharacterized protein (DUF433 family)